MDDCRTGYYVAGRDWPAIASGIPLEDLYRALEGITDEDVTTVADTTDPAGECTEEGQHKLRRQAALNIQGWLLDYQQAHGLPDIDMLSVLNEITGMYLRYVARDDEERRTGFRHRMAGE